MPRLLAALVAALLLAACGSSRGDPPRPARLAGLRLDQFPDLPLPPQWQRVPGEDQLAIAIGGGTERRLRLVLQAPPARTDVDPGTAMSRYVAGELPDAGWTREGEGRPGDLRQVWRKGGETLMVEAGRSGGVAVITWRLVPPPTPPLP